MSALNKQELITKLASQGKLTLKEAHDSIQFVLDEIVGALRGGRKVELRGFGVFKVVHRAERKGRNPAKPESGPIVIPARNVVKFRAGAELAEAVNHEPTPAATAVAVTGSSL